MSEAMNETSREFLDYLLMVLNAQLGWQRIFCSEPRLIVDLFWTLFIILTLWFTAKIITTVSAIKHEAGQIPFVSLLLSDLVAGQIGIFSQLLGFSLPAKGYLKLLYAEQLLSQSLGRICLYLESVSVLAQCFCLILLLLAVLYDHRRLETGSRSAGPAAVLSNEVLSKRPSVKMVVALMWFGCCMVPIPFLVAHPVDVIQYKQTNYTSSARDYCYLIDYSYLEVVTDVYTLLMFVIRCCTIVLLFFLWLAIVLVLLNDRWTNQVTAMRSRISTSGMMGPWRSIPVISVTEADDNGNQLRNSRRVKACARPAMDPHHPSVQLLPTNGSGLAADHYLSVQQPDHLLAYESNRIGSSASVSRSKASTPRGSMVSKHGPMVRPAVPLTSNQIRQLRLATVRVSLYAVALNVLVCVNVLVTCVYVWTQPPVSSESVSALSMFDQLVVCLLRPYLLLAFFPLIRGRIVWH